MSIQIGNAFDANASTDLPPWPCPYIIFHHTVTIMDMLLRIRKKKSGTIAGQNDQAKKKGLT